MGANCPACESKERHRLLALAVADGFVAFAGAEVLHFAAEPIVDKIVMDQDPAKYVTADIEAPSDLKLNLKNWTCRPEALTALSARTCWSMLTIRRLCPSFGGSFAPMGISSLMSSRSSRAGPKPLKMLRWPARRSERPISASTITSASTERTSVIGSKKSGFDLQEYTADARRAPLFGPSAGREGVQGYSAMNGCSRCALSA